MDTSPFIYDQPLPPEMVVGRDDEREVVANRHQSGRALVVSAPRRYGKTSLLGAYANDLAATGVPHVLVDLYGVQSLADVNIRLHRAYGKWASGGVRRTLTELFRSIDPSLSLGPVGLTLKRARHPDETLEIAHILLDLPQAILDRHGQRTWVVFDEFQSAWNVNGLEELIRSYTQQHRQAASYVFAGSQQSLLEQMFSDKGRPFYAQAEMLQLGPVAGSDLANLIERLFQESERHPGAALDLLLQTVDGHPQRAMLAAHLLWMNTEHGQVADAEAWNRTFDDLLAWTGPEISSRYSALKSTEQQAARALAMFGSPFAKDARMAVGDPATGTISTALTQLQREGDVVKEGRGTWRFTDPALPWWLQQTYG